MPTTQQTHTNLDELIEAHRQRLIRLQIQAARQGDETPAHILIEIERIEAELAQLRQAAAAATISDELVEELGPVGRYQLTQSHIMRLDTDIGRLTRQVEKLNERFEQLHN